MSWKNFTHSVSELVTVCCLGLLGCSDIDGNGAVATSAEVLLDDATIVTSEQAVTGGTAVTDVQATTYKLVYLLGIQDSQVSTCSGTMITKRRVLTAKHCFTGFTASNITVWRGNAYENGLASSARGTLITEHPSLDVAIITFDTDFAASDPKFWTLGSSPADMRNVPVTCYGYGVNESGKLRKASFTALAATNPATGTYWPDFFLLPYTSSLSLGSGDSGGPCYYTTPSGPGQIVGILSGTLSSGAQGSGMEVISSSFRDWADEKLTSSPTSLNVGIVGSPAVTQWLPGAAAPARLDVFARFSDGNIKQIVKEAGTLGSWASLGSDGATTNTTPAAISVPTKRLFLATKGASNNLYVKTCSNTCQGSDWGAWSSLGTTINSPPSLGLASANLYVFARRSDNILYMKTCNISSYACTSSSHWSAWLALDSARSTQAAFAPAAQGSATGVSSMDLFEARSDGKVYWRHCDTSCTAVASWSAWTAVGGAGTLGGPTFVTGQAEVATWVNPRLDVFAIGSSDKALYKRTWHAGGWRNWQKLNSGTHGSAPSGASPYTGLIELFSTASNGSTLQSMKYGD